MLKTKLNKSSAIYISGLLLLITSSILLLLSYGFSIETELTERPVVLFVIILILSSVIYLLAVNFRFSGTNFKKILFYIFIVGLLIRVITLFSIPILEDDYFRYLWDGAVTANGINPYIYSPEQILNDSTDNIKLKNLAEESGSVIKNINNPYLSTIYPPVSQLLFAVSYKLAPFDVYFWRVFLLLFDLITFFLLIIILRDLKLSSLNVLIYWWNPLLVNVIFNSGHFEVLVFPFMLSALILAYRKKTVSSVTALAISVGIKIWPLLLFPILLKSYYKKIEDLLKPFLVFSILTIAIFIPLIFIKLDSSSGIIEFGKSWENNSSIFRVCLYSFEQFLSLKNVHPGHAQRYARIFISIILAIWVLYQTVKYDLSKPDLFKRSLFIVAALFLISPAQFPWYYTWLLPFLAVVPKFSLIFLTVQLSLYYLRFYLEPRGLIEYFNNYVVWIEFVPVWILLILETRKEKLFGNF
ncbi:MAG: hypothetical protein ACR2NW_10370 [Thermodesulfobacteriota bacterium]